jgi:hypothetical protein
MKQITFILFILLLSASSFAQENKSAKKARKEEKRKKIDALIRQEEEGVISYKKTIGGGVKLNTDGYGGFFEIGRAKSVQKAMLFQLDISEKKHEKEYKSSPLISGASPFIYGKINFFYPVKLGIQLQMLLGNKTSKNGVSITGNLGGGLSLGLLRPYLVQVTKAGARTYVGYNGPDSALFLNSYTDLTASGPKFGTGWNKLKVTPGIYVKPAVRFDYGKFNEMINAVEVGVIGEFYSKKIPQMIYQKQKNLFLSAYVSIVFGKRK